MHSGATYAAHICSHASCGNAGNDSCLTWLLYFHSNHAWLHYLFLGSTPLRRQVARACLAKRALPPPWSFLGWHFCQPGSMQQKSWYLGSSWLYSVPQNLPEIGFPDAIFIALNLNSNCSLQCRLWKQWAEAMSMRREKNPCPNNLENRFPSSLATSYNISKERGFAESFERKLFVL